jgi:hypothetical protein
LELDRLILPDPENMFALNECLQQILPSCPHLETMSLFVIHVYQSARAKADICLDFRQLSNIRSLRLSETYSEHYEIVTGDESKFYSHAFNEGKFVEISQSEVIDFLIKIYLNKSILINQIRMFV